MEIRQEERSMEEMTAVKKTEERQEKESISASAKQHTPTNSPLPSSAASSPSHDFSFTISMHSSEITSSSTSSQASLSAKSRSNQAPFAIDLTPADEIFFHGHLLPLHFLSHLHVFSPRSSTNSIDSSTLLARDFSQNNKPSNNFAEDQTNEPTNIDPFEAKGVTHDNNKSKSFSIFGLAKWGKVSETKEKLQKTRKLKSDISQFVKRYIRMVKPLLSARGRGRRDDFRVRNQRESYSFSGSLSPRNHQSEFRGFRGELSAPASMRSSPTNSGRILATAGCPSPTSDSTMEELQAAIQAAITHCKKSISADDKSPEFSASVAVN